jgi:hypothetical protein
LSRDWSFLDAAGKRLSGSVSTDTSNELSSNRHASHLFVGARW